MTSLDSKMIIYYDPSFPTSLKTLHRNIKSPKSENNKSSFPQSRLTELLKSGA